LTREFENEIIESVLRGNVNAFESLVREYEKLVYNIALRLMGSPEDAADMAQETFLKAYRSLSSYRGDSRFSVWLYRITANVCLDALRAKSRKPTVSLTIEDEDGEDTQFEIPDTAPSPEELLQNKLSRESVSKCLMKLSEEQRRILVMREVAGLSYEEIGEALSLESGTVKSRIFRARRKLCSFLEEEGNIPDFISSVTTKGDADD